MLYGSTRNGDARSSAAQALLQGLAPDGGLFAPVGQFPPVPPHSLPDLDYSGLAVYLMHPYLTGFNEEELRRSSSAAYSGGRFQDPAIAPLRQVGDGLFFLELWHGPTSAFKDMALQVLPYLLQSAAAALGDRAETIILTATSGDTGKAALEGFRDIPGFRVIVFYPHEGVSEMQKMQMATQEGDNVHVIAIRGNFDDAQEGVKAIFADRDLVSSLAGRGFRLSSANSINLGRLLPQIVYYYHAYAELRRRGEIRVEEPIDVAVPTGNFGNILAAYYARRMGLPLRRLICASNRNHVLADFIHSGRYDRNRPFFNTTSPSMDILVSSNLERLLFDLSGCDGERVRRWMEQLQRQGSYEVDPGTKERIKAQFQAGFATEQETAAAIGRLFRETGYLMDPHTAVAYAVQQTCGTAGLEKKRTVIVSTASPFKFNRSVARAVLDSAAAECLPERELMLRLSEKAGLAVPADLSGLERKPLRHRLVVEPDRMKAALLGCLG